MPPIILALIEAMVLSPVVQDQAWAILKPHLEHGTMPTDAEIAQANAAADAAHAAVMG